MSDMAWLAGLVDGDGCIRADGSSPSFEVCSQHLPTLQKAKELLAGGTIRLVAGKKIYRLNLYGPTALEGTRKIEPYLFLKKSQAQLLLAMDYGKPQSNLEIARMLSTLKRDDGTDSIASSGHINDCSWAWLAGLFDAEGWVGIAHRRAGRSHTLQLMLNMTHKATIYRVHHLAESGRVSERKPSGTMRKQSYVWQANDLKTARVIQYLLSYSVTKHEQLLTAQDFLSLPKAVNQWSPIPAELFEQRECLRLRMQTLKQEVFTGVLPESPNPEVALANLRASVAETFNRGRKVWNKGLPATDKEKERLRDIRRTYTFTAEARQRVSDGLKGKPKSKSHVAKVAESLAKTWELRTPDGKVIVIRNLTQFCRDHNLSVGCLSAVARGDRRSHKGWTCRKLA
jgi:hypothetical protein